jgi:hypothetical protein
MSTPSGGRVSALRAQASTKSVRAGGGGSGISGASTDEGSEGKPRDPPANTLRAFFRAHLTEFTELSQDLKSMVHDMEEKKEKVEMNKRLLASLKADMMNRTLYALTLLTAVSIPMTFITGLWGMNFVDMMELDPVTAETEGLPMTGYRVFWTVLLSVVGTVVISMWRMGLFRMLG